MVGFSKARHDPGPNQFGLSLCVSQEAELHEVPIEPLQAEQRLGMAGFGQLPPHGAKLVHEFCILRVQQWGNVTKRVVEHIRLLDVIELAAFSHPGAGAKAPPCQQLEEFIGRDESGDHLQSPLGMFAELSFHTLDAWDLLPRQR